MTDNEIIKALECCTDGTGKGIIEAVLDLINRKNAEIERLNRNIELLAICKKDLPQRTTTAIKVEVAKEFAEKLKRKKYYGSNPLGYGTWVVEVASIDDTKKEMIG